MSYPLGEGQIEQLWAAEARGTIALVQAEEQARRMSFDDPLEDATVVALADHLFSLAEDGDWRVGVPRGRILLAAVEAAAPLSAGHVEALSAYLHCVMVSLIEIPDGPLLAAATERASGVIDALEASGQTALAAELLQSSGLMWLMPYVEQRSSALADRHEFEWFQRGLHAHAIDGVDADPERWAMPTRDEALDAAGAQFRRALAIASPNGRTSKFLLETLVWPRPSAPDGIGTAEEIIEVGRAARNGLDPHRDGNHLLFVLAVLDRHGEPVDQSVVEAMVDRSLDQMVATIGKMATADVHLQAARLLMDAAPARALALLGRIRPMLGDPRLEPLRVVSIDTTRTALRSLHGVPTNLVEREPVDFQAMVREILAAASAQRYEPGFDVEAVAVWLLAIANDCGAVDQEEAGSQAMEMVPGLVPWFVTEHVDLLRLTDARLALNQAVNAYNSDDLPTAIHHYARATRIFAGMGLTSAVLDCLGRLVDVADKADPDAAAQLAVTLWSIARVIERQLGDAALESMTEICRLLMRAIAVGETNPELLLFLLQLIKGHRASALLTGGLRPAAGDGEHDVLLEQLRNRPPLPSPSSAFKDRILVEARLVSPYDSRPSDPQNEDDITTNLQRRFDEAHERDLLERIADEQGVMISVSDLQRTLDARTVLLSLYLGLAPDGSRCLQTVVVWDEGITAGMSIMTDWPPGQTITLGQGPSSVSVTADEFEVASLRSTMMDDPGDLPATSDLVESLDSLGAKLFGPMAGQLGQLRAEGRDHLAIWPHGPLHFVPFPLIGSPTEDDQPTGQRLADVWTTTVLPNLQLLLDHRGQPHPRVDRLVDLTAIGITGAGADLGFPAIPEAADEAREIAATWGVEPVLDGEATKARVIDALATSRHVHLATHAEHNVGAPAFQTLLLAGDDQLPAHEVAGLDLANLELVTLSACETALGKFDLGDNLRGLAHSLFLAGARTVVATLWPVETVASQTFFVAFYAELRAGATRGDAFAAAQAATRARCPQLRDWGAFQLLGAWW